MIHNTQPQFRPSLFLFVGEVGAQIREYLSPYYGSQLRVIHNPATPSTHHLLGYLDTPLRNSVGLLQVVADPKTTRAIAFPVMDTFPTDPDMPKGDGPLEDMIHDSLFSVQLARRIDTIRNADYSIPNPRTQVFIIGEPGGSDGHLLAATLKAVHASAKKLNMELPTCYVLNNYDTHSDYSTLLQKSSIGGGLTWANFELANFSYLYETIIPYPAPMTVSKESVRYATAEALLALAATGMTSLPIFESVLQISHALENYAPHVGNLSTSMIRFPRPSVRRYCAAHLTHDLVERWRRDLDISIMTLDERSQAKERGWQLVQNLGNWILPEETNTLVEENQRPSLEILRYDSQLPGVKQPVDEQQNAYEQVQDKTNDLFSLFSYENMAETYRKQRRKDKTLTWSELAQRRTSQAVGAYEQWERTAKHAWNLVDACVNDHVTFQVDRNWTAGPKGFVIARIFVDQFDDELAKFAIEVSERRSEHSKDYRRQRSRFSKLSDGVWSLSVNQQSVTMPTQQGQQVQTPHGQARPTMSNTPLQKNAPTGTSGTGGSSGSGGGGGGSSLQLIPLHLPPTEEQIARDMHTRAVWKQNRVPSATALGSVGLLGWLMLSFSASTLNLSFPFLIAAITLMATMLVVSNVALYIQRRREFVDAQQDVLEFYQRYYDFKCSEREDLQRMALVRTLRSRVARMRYRLDNMSSFLGGRARAAQHDAQEASTTLFEGPGSTRDVFIADGERLLSQGTHTLESVNSKVEQMRQNSPAQNQDWHRTLDSMKDRMVQELQRGNRSLIDMDEQQLQNYLYEFTEPIIDCYLTGPLVDISAALDKPDIWRNASEQMRRPLYDATTGVLDPHLAFVCGSRRALAVMNRVAKRDPNVPKDAFQLLINGDEWLMVGGFFRGGTPRTLNADALFPVKSLPPLPASSGSGASSTTSGSASSSSTASSPGTSGTSSVASTASASSATNATGSGTP